MGNMFPGGKSNCEKAKENTKKAEETLEKARADQKTACQEEQQSATPSPNTVSSYIKIGGKSKKKRPRKRRGTGRKH